ncbi:Uncharacterised protein [Mycobacteroides abscessus subsp. abscessus]|nr:Uncharacterised protein [Mycobacteroides abscessus subsp. abscessus]
MLDLAITVLSRSKKAAVLGAGPALAGCVLAAASRSSIEGEDPGAVA